MKYINGIEVNDYDSVVKSEYPYNMYGNGTALDKIDYAIISENHNPEYLLCYPKIKERWNQLGIKCILVKIDIATEDPNKSSPYMEQNIDGKWKGPTGSVNEVNLKRTDDFGNIVVSLRVNFPLPKVLHRWFGFTIARFWIAAHNELSDKILVISDGDLIPINKKYIYQLAYRFPLCELICRNRVLVCSNMYAEGNFPATFTYGLGSTFKKLFSECDDKLSFDDLIKFAEDRAWYLSKMYLTEEQLMNYLYKKYDNICKWAGNRMYTEHGQDMNNLYDHQIDLLNCPQDLAPFVEFHSFSTTSMSINNRWDRLFHLLSEYDKMDITPNCWFYNTVIYKWRDTKVTKNGLVILGDEYDK